MTCSTCIHFLSRGVTDASADPRHPRREPGEGTCRRYPPRLQSVTWSEHGVDAFSAFPTVHQNQACGEFSAALSL
ncbi:hypothetical protein Q9Q95_13430 [Sphingomonas sp. DG1-23]|uniref:hypothetical protein n=1 Tax=Sphingomonas sp. DG1-23 TaxID=3068316 RepID=UPI00273F8143|nr:hypothetical protein [Sphingomonas sp. DG1-23]MDP5279931.1 hypothetical protein [Sphingomonas sp. DG1-23]